MGRSITPKYAIRFVVLNGRFTPQAWNVQQNGKPTVENIDKFIADLENSMKPGGVNAHCGQYQVLEATVHNQFDGNKVVAHWQRSVARPNQPMFEAV